MVLETKFIESHAAIPKHEKRIPVIGPILGGNIVGMRIQYISELKLKYILNNNKIINTRTGNYPHVKSAIKIPFTVLVQKRGKKRPPHSRSWSANDM